ncbi:cytochrome c oxidase subunit IV [Loa loa]|uniref:Cytochrome c oxidase subunit 4 n=1 Tax=Loa loa TaxID=7209 RepID=A0A1I7W028_LOALO|nr:cytochrome c oxidase subunit IV [Loa loa]EFO22950.1 cytochrome c oxidase subunit IV [Loa loa]
MTLVRSSIIVQSKSTPYIVRHAVLLSAKHHNEYCWQKQRIGQREIVGPSSGGYHFIDSTDRPYPPLRFRADDEIIKPIREKEKGDWKKLTMEEKKLLYRYSFRRTQAELLGWNVYWKMYLAYALIWSSIGLGVVGLLRHFSYPPQVPTLSDEWKHAAMQKILILEKPLPEGAATLYDYENDRWKD